MDMESRNTAVEIKEQAVALRSSSDSDFAVFYRCSFDAFHPFKKCNSYFFGYFFSVILSYATCIGGGLMLVYLFARRKEELGFPYNIKFLLFTFLYAALLSPSPLVLEIMLQIFDSVDGRFLAFVLGYLSCLLSASR